MASLARLTVRMVRLAVRLARLTVRMVRLAVRLAWLTPQQARGAEYDMWRATRENDRKIIFHSLSAV